MANKDLKVGDRVSFLRMSNKAVSLTGTIEKVYEDGVPCVEVKLDDSDHIETAHMDDVAVLGEEKPAEQGTSLHTVNGKPI